MSQSTRNPYQYLIVASILNDVLGISLDLSLPKYLCRASKHNQQKINYPFSARKEVVQIVYGKMGHSQPLFLYFRLFNTVESKMVNINFCRWLDSNCRPLKLEASTNWATTTAHTSNRLCEKRMNVGLGLTVNFYWPERHSTPCYRPLCVPPLMRSPIHA